MLSVKRLLIPGSVDDRSACLRHESARLLYLVVDNGERTWPREPEFRAADAALADVPWLGVAEDREKGSLEVVEGELPMTLGGY